MVKNVIANFDRPRYAIERWGSEPGAWVFVKSMDNEFDAKVQAQKFCEKFDADTRVIDRGDA